MNTICTLATVSAVVLALAGTGCAHKALYFGTNTSLGLDVSGTTEIPNRVSVAYQRTEAAIVPRISGSSGANQQVSVLGKVGTNLKFFGDQSIRQIFATGVAAQQVANEGRKVGEGGTYSDNGSVSDESETLVFATHSTFGFSLAYGDATIAPELVLGYKRGEATVIPVHKGESDVRSVYGDISITSGRNAATGGVEIYQTFATGKAAEVLTAGPQALEIKKSMGLAVTSPEDAQDRMSLLKKYNAASPEQKKRFDAIVTEHGFADGADFFGSYPPQARYAEITNALRADPALAAFFQ